ncbi:nicotinate-nucleotide pyrophosphorylase [Rozella allomycis CSF55]|uniref:Nicotinate-nucleotide pyrophosphorylase [carboxylating] n=1 Tax=Rozella allomycis (strain CSF55) TaxID=988480 RepID=A0A075B4B4_ROZAC|nr:Nicotinate-nucleotide pyrophosphorylase domain-containing protein [Rozella allomycis CSF55]RKP20805.1 nicotinate-nucleotide pyrophosphorylase [Rozella allomycis CSF55]|eukprot:EPZ36027.1 Nicotinate-nucleotide pyrophosphorylase domain-containing protein [Rozella allomycis CSF55]
MAKNLEHLLPISWKYQIHEWLKEDIPSFDIAGYVVGEKFERASLICKSHGILAGKPFVNEIFNFLSCSVSWCVDEGTEIVGDYVTVASVDGPARNILLGERLALNILARCSGIASECFKLNQKKRAKAWNGVISGTRKTTPGFRLVEKYGMIVGGCDPHRMDLSSLVMLKDNHIWSQGSIANSVKAVKEICKFALKIEVECRNFEEALEACESGADIVMLDHVKPGSIADVKSLKEKHPMVIVEVSGGINENNIEEYMIESVDVVSTGAITQSFKCVDFSLKINKK